MKVVLTSTEQGQLPVDIQGIVRARYARPGPRHHQQPVIEAAVESQR